MVRMVPQRPQGPRGVPHAQVAIATGAPDVLTVRETATLLRVERKTIYDLAARGELPGVRRLGRLTRISRSAILQWLAESLGCGDAPSVARGCLDSDCAQVNNRYQVDEERASGSTRMLLKASHSASACRSPRKKPPIRSTR
jgi:excisionase family DNA binding protein